ncbi:chondroitin sulfate proteoglycan 5b isoform X3 [Eucyclogobius newberryi]|uniref:chondroitin sulfate proteoglycan 5b isoform X3 n=1 Tax=Eucyclogobius newberryi TaxID=166745 RepID=UPI003B59D36C
MARAHDRLRTWQVLLTISIFILPLTVHGRHALGKHHRHHNQSSVHKESLTPRMVLSDDSAERDHLIGLGASLPLSSKRHHSHKHKYLDFIEEEPPMGEEFTAGGAGPEQPGNPMVDGVIVAFHSPAPDTVPTNEDVAWAKAPQAQKQKPDSKQTTWSINDFYEYTDTDLSAVDPTTDPEPTPSPPATMEDENPMLTEVTKKVWPDIGASLPAPPKLDPGKKVDAEGADGCRLGFVRTGTGVCVSQCELEPNFCLNDGVCTVVPGMGAFCRCNMQNYIWNKGTRCDQMVTEFQVMCVVVGVSSCVLILLFMIIVCFGKRLHRLKSENRRLRKRSKYRPQSTEPPTDGLSLSTTAEGSQPNVRKLCDTPPPAPQAHSHNLAYYDNIICQDEPQKHNDLKSPQSKEDGSMNILNSHSPKHENNRPTSMGHEHAHAPHTAEDNTEDGVTIGLEVLLPKEAKRHSDSNPLQYDVFLYKVANNGDSVQTEAYGTPNAKSKSPKTPRSSKSHKHKSPKRSRDKSPHAREPLTVRPSSPDHQHSPSHHPSPSARHSAPGCYSSPSSHQSHHSPSQYKCLATTPPQLRRPRGRSQAPGSRHSAHDVQYQGRHIHPSPSSPHLTQPSQSPTRVKYSPVSTRSLPPLS